MPFSLIWGNSGVIFSYSGNVSSDEAIKSNEKYYGSSLSDKAQYQIIDFSNVDSVLIDNSTIEIIASMDNVHFDTSLHYGSLMTKVAFVGQDKAISKIYDKYKLFLVNVNSNIEVQYFDLVEAAQKWANS